MKLNDDGKTVAAMDCLVPGIGEIIGASQREDNYDVLLARMKELDMPIENYDWYLDLRNMEVVFILGLDLVLRELLCIYRYAKYS